MPPASRRFAAGGVDPRVKPEDDGIAGATGRPGAAAGGLRPHPPSPSRHPRPPSRGSMPPASRRFAAGGVDPRVKSEDDGTADATGRPGAAARGVRPHLPSPSRHPRPPSRGSMPPASRRCATGGVDPRVKPEDDGTAGATGRPGAIAGGVRPHPPSPSRHPRPPSRGSMPQASRRFAVGGVDPLVKPEDDGIGGATGRPGATARGVRPHLPSPSRHPRPPSRGSMPPASRRFAAGGVDPRVKPEDDGIGGATGRPGAARRRPRASGPGPARRAPGPRRSRSPGRGPAAPGRSGRPSAAGT